MSKESLIQLFNTCCEETEGNKVRGAQRFLIRAKKVDPNVTLTECMDATGFSDPDEKKASNLAQTFRSKIFNPLRDHIAKVRFQISDVTPIFGRTGVDRTPEQKKIREEILSILPKITRGPSPQRGDMSYLNDLIVEEEDAVAAE